MVTDTNEHFQLRDYVTCRNHYFTFIADGVPKVQLKKYMNCSHPPMVFLEDNNFVDVMVPDGLHQLLNSTKWIHTNVEKYCGENAKNWQNEVFRCIGVHYYDDKKTRMRPLTGKLCKKYIDQMVSISPNTLSNVVNDSEFMVKLSYMHT